MTGQTFEACHKECSQKPKPTKQPTSQPASQPAAQLDQPRPTQPRLAQLSNAQPSPAAQPGPAQDPVQALPAEPRPAQLGSAAQTRSQIIQASCTQLGQPVFFLTNPGLANIVGGTDLRSDEFHSFMGFSHLRIPTFPYKGWIATRFAHWSPEAPNRKYAL